jgi:hypothetical protein
MVEAREVKPVLAFERTLYNLAVDEGEVQLTVVVSAALDLANARGVSTGLDQSYRFHDASSLFATAVSVLGWQ